MVTVELFTFDQLLISVNACPFAWMIGKTLFDRVMGDILKMSSIEPSSRISSFEKSRCHIVPCVVSSAVLGRCS